MIRKAVILLSGGLDSATVLAIAKAQGLDCYALSFRYGQRHAAELDAAGRVAKHLGVTQHVVLDIHPRPFGGPALTSDIPVPQDRRLDCTNPVTYRPARDTNFFAFALASAQ